jgi:hypothetical protein
MIIARKALSTSQLFCPSVDASGQQPELVSDRVSKIIPNAAGEKGRQGDGKITQYVCWINNEKWHIDTTATTKQANKTQCLKYPHKEVCEAMRDSKQCMFIFEIIHCEE